MGLNLKNKVVLITGAHNPFGIGAATAFKFAEEGASVVIVYKRLHFTYNPDNTHENGYDKYHKMLSADASTVEQNLRKLTDNYLILEKDIAAIDAANEIFDIIKEKFGSVDILVNNAAMYDANDTVFTVDAQGIDTTIGVNVKAAVLLIKEFVKRAKNGGRIINISTDAAQRFAGQIMYGASKAAMEALTRSIAIEVGKFGITVNTVAPGPIQTGWIDKQLEQQVLPDIPMGRIGMPDDIADTILFLASDRAKWITGQVIQVSGGHAI
ncbi:MAG TPA: SDR family oxidoreductase [Cyclobacteriaceae bacterium]|nr:SDR family oxidoreductase [Cyclobacteriaceae bacterium]